MDENGLHSFPTRRSSDLDDLAVARRDLLADHDPEAVGLLAEPERTLDRVVIGRAHDVEAGGLDRERLDSDGRSEEHTSELQLAYLVCRLLLEKKKSDSSY